MTQEARTAGIKASDGAVWVASIQPSSSGVLAGATVVQRDPVRISAAQQQYEGRYLVQQVWRYHPIR